MAHRCRSWGVVLGATALGVTVAAAAPRRPKLTPCPPGRFLVDPQRAPLIQGAAAPAIEAVEVAAPARVSITSGCAEVRAKVTARRSFTQVTAKWPVCGSKRKVRLEAKIATPACNVMKGRLEVRGSRPKNFRAVRSACGDGIVDRDGAEQCETDAQCTGGAACGDCRCAPSFVTTTTVTTTPTSTSTSTTLPPAPLSFSASLYEVDESAGNVLVTIVRGGPATGGVTVRLVTLDGTATAGGDYTTSTGMVQLAAGENAKQVAVPIADDGVAEPTETIRLFLTDPGAGAAVGNPSSALLAIRGTAPDLPLVALPGTNRTVTLGEKVMLTAGALNALGPPSFQWALAAKPAGSGAAIADPAAAMQTLAPDVVGAYTFRLVASDALRTSAPADLTLDVVASPPPEPAAVSVAGVRFTAEAKGMADPRTAIVMSFAGPVDPATLTSSTVRLTEQSAGAPIPVPADLAFDAADRSLTLTPQSPLGLDRFFRLEVSDVGATADPFVFTPFSTTFMTPGEEFSFVSGVILAPDRHPLELVTVRVAGQTQLTDAGGAFFFENVPLGPQDVEMDPSTVLTDVVYTPMHFTIDVKPGVQGNTMGNVIVLSIIDTAHAVNVPPGGVLTNPSLPGLAIDLTGVAASDHHGAAYAGPISVSNVPPSDVPMPFPGAATQFWTIQPGGLTLTPPAPVTVGLPIEMDPGVEVDLWTFDHATFQWVMYARGVVNPDGVTASSKPGEGLPFTGWAAVVTQTEVTRPVGGVAPAPLAGQAALASEIVGLVVDAEDNGLNGVRVEPEGGLAIFTDIDNGSFTGSERGAYKVDSVVVGFNRMVNGEFDSFVPRPVTIRATARDMTGEIHTAQTTIDIAALADETKEDGNLPAVLSPDPIKLTDYPVVKDGKILLHEALVFDGKDHFLEERLPSDPLVTSPRYVAEVNAMRCKLASMGFRQAYDGQFLAPAGGYSAEVAMAAQVFQTVWVRLGHSYVLLDQSRAVGPTELQQINGVNGVIWTQNHPFSATNGFGYNLVNQNRWFHGTTPTELTFLSRKTGLNSATPAIGGPRPGLPHSGPRSDEHQAGAAADVNMLTTTGASFGGTFYRCLKASYDTNPGPCSVTVDAPGDVPAAVEEWTDADRALDMPDEDTAIERGRTWVVKDNYGRDLTRQFIEEMLAQGVRKVIYNDPQIAPADDRFRRVGGHQHHIHMTWNFRHGDVHPAGTDGAPSFPCAASPFSPLRHPPQPLAAASGFMVVSVSPDDPEQVVPPSAALTVDFSAAVDPSTLTPASVVLFEYNTGRAVAATLTLDAAGTHLVIAPNAPLEEATSHVLRLTADIEDVAGNALDLGGVDEVALFTTGLSESVLSADFGSSLLTLSRSDLSQAALAITGRVEGGGTRDLGGFLLDSGDRDAARNVLDSVIDDQLRLTRVLNGHSILTAATLGPGAEVAVDATILDPPAVTAHVLVGSPVVATFSESLQTTALEFVSASVVTMDGETKAGSAALSGGGTVVTFTPAALLPTGIPLNLFVTVAVEDPQGRRIEVVTVSPFAVVGDEDLIRDTDGDGLTDLVEGTIDCVDPDFADTDGDGVTDDREDCDGDRLTNRREVQLGTDPDAADTDGDGAADGFEVTRGCNALVAEVTTAAGRVLDAQADPVGGAEVHTVGAAQPAVQTALDGTFTLGPVSGCGDLQVIATATVDGEALRGLSPLIPPVLGGTTDAGDVALRPIPTFLYPEPRFTISEEPSAVVAVDLDHDDVPDLVAQLDGEGLSVRLGLGDGSFGPEIQSDNVQQFGQKLRLAHLNGDQHLDAIVPGGPSATQVSVLLGNGDGSFQPRTALGGFASPADAKAADLNGDTVLDLAVASPSSPGVSILIGNGNGTFQAASPIPGVDSALALAPVRFDTDSILDLAVADGTGFGIAFLTGVGDGTFEAGPSVILGYVPEQLESAHMNDDALLDLVAFSPGQQAGTILLAQAGGGFSISGSFTVPLPPGFFGALGPMTLADTNDDGRLDVLVPNRFEDDVSLFLGNGNGTLQAEQQIVGAASALSVAAADFDGNGTLDLVTGNRTSRDLALLLGRGDGTFLGPLRTGLGAFPSGSFPLDLLVANFDGDAMLDAAAVSLNSNVVVLQGTGGGTFGVKQTLGVNFQGSQAVGVDVDGGAVDLVVPGDLSEVSVLRGNGDGTFQSEQRFTTIGPLRHVSASDFDGDGDQDLVALTRTPPSFVFRGVLLPGRGDGTFESEIKLFDANFPQRLLTADLDNDGNLDLVFVEFSSEAIGVLLGDGAGGFSAVTHFGVAGESSVQNVAIADVNRDAALDLISVFGQAAQIGVLFGLGDGTFDTEAVVSSGVGAQDMVVADVDLDGLLDIVAATDVRLAVLPGNGDGTFRGPQLFGTQGSPTGVQVADFDGDGLPDVALVGTPSSGNAGALSVLLHQ
jgi:hypothetical protein